MKNSANILLVLLFTFSCNSGEKEVEQLFSLLSPATTGVDFVNQLTENEQFNIIEYLYFNNGAGVAAGDINNDGLADLYFTSNQRPNKLYLNKGHLKFEDITEKAGVSGKGNWKTGVTMADVNGDGFLDIYVCQVSEYKTLQGKNQLFINQGDLTFIEEAQEYGIDFKGFSTQAAFFDYDSDGDLDMYLLNHSVHAARNYGRMELRYEEDPRAGDKLFSNELSGNRRVFREVTREAGIFSSHIGYGLGVNICDINNDGYPDIYVSNDFHEDDYLYMNNGNGTFTERLKESIAHTSRSSMGNDVGDINNDGMLDIIVLDMLPDMEENRQKSGGEDDYELSQIKLNYGYNHQFVRNTLQLNLGGGLFSEIGIMAGIHSTDWSWSPLFCDFDNDGWKDLFIASGIYRRANDLDYISYLTGGNRFFPEKDNRNVTDKVLYEHMPLYPNVNYFFRNNHDLTFSNITNSSGLNKRSYSNGSTYADLDNDGDLEIVVNNINERAYIYKNNASDLFKNHYLSIALKGDKYNTRGIGTRVTVFCNGLEQTTEQFATRGFMSATSDILHFGLGNAGFVDSIIVRWPGRLEQRIRNIDADTTISLDIREAVTAVIMDHPEKISRLFSSDKVTGLQYSHKEDPYVDFHREKLIPHSLSAEGPAIAVGDVNGDRMDDVFIGGAKGQQSKIFIQQKNGSFISSFVPAGINDRFTDNTDAVFFDADNDGDNDLYIVKGGNELLLNNPLLKDRLLINDGNGKFADSENGAIPLLGHNGSCVKPADLDGDGDMDLFVGSRSVPGAYGLSPDQFLLENDENGRFRDVTGERAGDLKNIGMVTDAVWMDYDNDGDNDLVVVGEWMNICLFSNEAGYLKEVTTGVGLNETSGWWNCIETADIDMDGDQDLIAGNVGLNSMLKASKNEPVEMYINDFDNNGSHDQLICSYKEGISYPFASLDELSAQITGVRKRFRSYADFAGKTAVEIFEMAAMEQSILKKAEIFESCLFLNNDNRTFSKTVLPAYAQFSSVRDVLINDYNGDQKNDLILVGNKYPVRPSYGRYDASYGWYMQGIEKNKFKTLMPVESGFVIKGDARRVIPVEINGRQCLIVTVNNSDLQVFFCDFLLPCKK